MFHPTSLDPVEVIMTMIRAIKIDHDTNPECSLFGIHIRHMTNDSNLGVYICIFGLSLKLMIIFLVLVAVIWQLCILRHIFLEFKMVLDQWFELVHDEDVLIHVLACFHV